MPPQGPTSSTAAAISSSHPKALRGLEWRHDRVGTDLSRVVTGLATEFLHDLRRSRAQPLDPDHLAGLSVVCQL